MGAGESSIPRDDTMRVFAVSDLHSDWEENMELLQDHLNSTKYGKLDVLIVAGDARNSIPVKRYGNQNRILQIPVFSNLSFNVVEETLRLLSSAFGHVFFVNGNNELRLDRKEKKFKHSFDKFKAVLQLCEEFPNVYTKPKQIGGVWIVPLFSWYEPALDPTYDNTNSYQRRWLDFRACRWPDEYYDEDNYTRSDQLADAFLAMNEVWIEAETFQFGSAPVITYSHFLPRFELLPARIFMKNKTMPLVMGSPSLEKQLRKLNPLIHVCGHSHINFDSTYDGIRYIQNALGHPRERRALWRRFEAKYAPKLVFSAPIPTQD